MENSTLFCIFLCFVITASSTFDTDCYWKDYDGIVPPDAFVAVQNGDDTPAAYIGQGFILAVGIFPASLFPNATSLSITQNGKNTVISENLKILATRTPWAFRWVNVTYEDIETLKKFDFLQVIEGGVENNKVVYIGRHVHEGKMQIGKVYNAEGVALPNISGGASTFLNFEILVYISLIEK